MVAFGHFEHAFVLLFSYRGNIKKPKLIDWWFACGRQRVQRNAPTNNAVVTQIIQLVVS